MSRSDIVRDAGKHLAEKIGELTVRHISIMQGGGLSTAEGVAAILTAAEIFSATAIAMLLTRVPVDRQLEAGADAVDALAASLHIRLPATIANLAVVQDLLAALQKAAS